MRRNGLVYASQYTSVLLPGILCSTNPTLRCVDFRASFGRLRLPVPPLYEKNDGKRKRVDSLEAVGITANPSSLSSSFSSGDNVTGDPAGGTHDSKSKSADGGVELKRFSAEISVDLSSREGWKEGENGDRDGRGGGGSASNGNKRIRGSGRDGDVFIGVGVEHEEGGKEAFPAQSPSRLPSANSVGAGVAVGSGRSEGWVDGVGSLASPVPRWGSGGEGASSSGNKGHVNLRKGRSALQVAKDKKVIRRRCMFVLLLFWGSSML